MLAGFISFLDLFALSTRLISYVKSVRNRDITFSLSSFWFTAILGKEDHRYLNGSDAEYTGLVVEDPEEFEEQELKAASSDETEPMKRTRPAVAPIKTVSFDDTTNWAQSASSDRTMFNHSRHESTHSDETLQEITAQMIEHKPWYRKVGSGIFATLERVLVFAGFLQILTGIVIYTGGCRGNWLNGCLAHLIKGGIFWCYVSGRFLRSISYLNI